MKKILLINFIYGLMLVLFSCNNEVKENNKKLELNAINNKLQENTTKDTCYKGVMMIEEQPVFCILDSAHPKEASSVMQKNYEKILKDIEYTQCSTAEYPGCIFYYSSPEKIVFETFMFLKSKPKRQPKVAKPVILEKTLGLLYDHYGSFNTIHQSYEKIKDILDKENYEQAGPSREIYIVKDDTSQWRTRIIVPVIKKK